MAKAIARHEKNISLNPLEYILDNNGDVRLFGSDEEAIEFLNEHAEADQTKEEWEDEGIFIVDYED